LVALDEKYGAQGLAIVAFPSLQFGGQEFGTSEEIAKFAEGKGAKFQMMSTVDVNGAKASPVWSYLKGACDTCGGDVKWNFSAKFLVDKAGNVVERNGDNPAKSEAKIQDLLSK